MYRYSPTYAYSYVPDGLAQIEYCAKSELSVHMDIYKYVNKIESSINPNSNTLEPDRPRYDQPAACVIAQQYSSASFFSLRFQTRKESFGERFKSFISSYMFFTLLKLGV